MRRSIFWVIFISLVALVGTSLALFLNQNSDPVVLYFGTEWMGYFKTREINLGNLLLLTLLSGILASALILAGSLASRSIEVRRLRRELEAIQRSLDLRTRK